MGELANVRKDRMGKKKWAERKKGASAIFTYAPSSAGQNSAISENPDDGNSDGDMVNFANREVLIANTHLPGHRELGGDAGMGSSK